MRDSLVERLGPRISTAQAIREQHSHGEGLPTVGMPDLVAFPENNDEVAFILALCNAHRVPIVPFGAGSSLEGQVAALAGGISLDMNRFDKVLQISPEALDCRVQAGVTREALNAHIRDIGLFFPVDPGANASIGGMASTRASGTNAGAIVPQDYGGAGLDYLTYGLIVEQIGRGDSAMRTVVSVQTSLVCSGILRWA